MYALLIKDAAELERYIPAWEKLVAAAIEPNVFYEPWMLLPAVRAFGNDKQLRFVLILDGQQQPSLLHALFPLEVHTHYNGLGKRLPVKTLSLWRHPRCYVCTPLLSARHAREALSVFFAWLNSKAQRCSLMEFGHINGDGPFARLLIDHFYRHANLTCITDSYTRAFFKPRSDAGQYLREAASPKHRRTYRSQENKLAQQGSVEYVQLERADDVSNWIEQFLKLEASGWKGHEGSAFDCSEADRVFFADVVTEGFRRGQLMMLALYLNGQPIASKCNLLAGPGSYAFRIAYDEEYSRFSPGLLLELENIRQLHARPEICWMDSCADPDNFMVNHLWLERRTIPTLVVGTGRRPGDLVVATIPMLRWLNRKLLLRRSVGAGND